MKWITVELIMHTADGHRDSNPGWVLGGNAFCPALKSRRYMRFIHYHEQVNYRRDSEVSGVTTVGVFLPTSFLSEILASRGKLLAWY